MLLYFKYYLSLAFESWLVSNLIWSKNDRILPEANEGEGMRETLFDRGDGISYCPGPKERSFLFYYSLFEVSLDHPEPFKFLFFILSLILSLKVGISNSSSNDTFLTSVKVGTFYIGFSIIDFNLVAAFTRDFLRLFFNSLSYFSIVSNLVKNYIDLVPILIQIYFFRIFLLHKKQEFLNGQV